MFKSYYRSCIILSFSILVVAFMCGCGVDVGKCYTITTQSGTHQVWATSMSAQNGKAKEVKLFVGDSLRNVFYDVESSTSKPGQCPCEHEVK